MQDMIGQILAGRYRVETVIGRGGMAEVYKVWDTRRAVHLAMKVLREDIAQDRVFIRRFKREAQTLAALQHPNIVRLYGLEQDDLLVFMLMDYIEGTNLRAEILRTRGPIHEKRVLEVMRPVCSALHYAHNQGVIHCDIKPGNIMIDRRGTVLVADFGIARATEGATVTMVGVGTPAYMAPELVMGQVPSSQTDIYALGIMLYEMLTGGERPFTGEAAQTTSGTTGEKVRWEQVNLKPPSPKKFNHDLLRGIETVVLRCLSKEPEQRYPAPLDLLNALEGVMGEAKAAALPRAAEAGPAPRVEALAMDSVKPEPAGLCVIPSVQPAQHEEPLSVQPIAPTASEMLTTLPQHAQKTTPPAAKPLPKYAKSHLEQNRSHNRTLIAIGGGIITIAFVAGVLALSGVFRNIYVEQLARMGVPHNNDWKPYTKNVDDVLMALVPAGCFQMGSERGNTAEIPVHRVCFEQPFWIDVYEVTYEQFYPTSETYSGDKRARVNILWAEAANFCNRRGARLPTEAEWEYVARGPDGLIYPWGNDFVAGNVVYSGNSAKARAVGSAPGGVSWVGAYDLSGNVSEWVADSFSISYYETLEEGAVDPKGPTPGDPDYKVFRGGSVASIMVYELRTNTRFWLISTHKNDVIGLRCARSD